MNSDIDPPPAVPMAHAQQEVTEALLRVVPDLTSLQIIEARKWILRIAQGHSWIDG